MIVGADAERSCSRRRSVTDAACPSRVLIGPLMQPHFLFSARKGNGVARQRKRGLCETGSTSRAGIASEEGCSVPLSPGRRKRHIRSLLLPSRKPTAVLGRLSVPIRKGKRRPGKPFGWFPRTPSIDQSLALDLRRMEVLDFAVFAGREMTAIIKIACGVVKFQIISRISLAFSAKGWYNPIILIV